jgi:hypothetical protein
MASTIFNEIRTRLEMTEASVEWIRRRFRSLPADHADRGVLLRQLETAAAVSVLAFLVVVGRAQPSWYMADPVSGSDIIASTIRSDQLVRLNWSVSFGSARIGCSARQPMRSA